MTTKRAAILDVDGTLVDSNHLHVVTWWEAFRQAGRQVPMREIHRAVGLGSGDLIEHLLGDDRDPAGDDQLAAAHHALYATYFERLPALDEAGDLPRALAGRGWKIVLATSAGGPELSAFERLPALDEAGDLPRALAGRGWKIVLATSAGGPELSALHGAIDADDVIHGAASADDVDDGKPAPDPVRQAREPAGVPSERAVFVGDAVWGMKAAVRDGVVPVAVLSGGIPRADLEAAGARALYRDPADLLRHLDTNVFADRESAGENRRHEPLTGRSVLVVQGDSAPGYRFVGGAGRVADRSGSGLRGPCGRGHVPGLPGRWCLSPDRPERFVSAVRALLVTALGPMDYGYSEAERR